jgi:hypothetical protein
MAKLTLGDMSDRGLFYSADLIVEPGSIERFSLL